MTMRLDTPMRVLLALVLLILLGALGLQLSRTFQFRAQARRGQPSSQGFSTGDLLRHCSSPVHNKLGPHDSMRGTN